jgi:cell wall-associated NlpC family hydrolase
MRMRFRTATILAAGGLALCLQLAPAGGAVAEPAASSASAGNASGPLSRTILAVLNMAKGTGAFHALEGSLVYLGAKYESQTEAKKAPAPAPEPEKVSAEEKAGVSGETSLPPASAGTNGTPIPPPPGGVGRGKPLVAQAPAPPSSGAASATATYVSGIALAPPDAPERIAGAINAANTIVGRPYIWGGGHGSWYSRGYDCSGAVSFALAGGGFLASPLTSGQLESWGAPGPGRWLTVFASPTHTYAVIAGLRWDTVGDARGTGPRWHLAGAVPAGFVARHPPGY